MHLSLRNKTIVSIAVIEAVLLVALIFTAINFMRNTLNENLVSRSTTVATLFASTTKNAVLTYDLASLETYCAELLSNPDILYVRVVNTENQVLAQAGDNNLLARQFNQDIDVSNVTDGVFDSFVNITEAEQLYGRVELGVDTLNIQDSLEVIKKWTTSIAIIEMALVALFSFFLGNYLTRQLESLRIAARKVSQNVESGSFNQAQLPVNGKDELAEVTRAFNKLVTTLEYENSRKQAYQDELEELNRTLEQKVAQRTTLLHQRNDELEQINQELQATQEQLTQAAKMASIGQLAAGVAHEINNPIGFVKSNLSSLEEYIDIYRKISENLVVVYGKAPSESVELSKQNLIEIINSEDLAFINEDSKDVLVESVEGLERVTNIVKDLKQFSRVDVEEKSWLDINECIESTLKMVSNELKYHCDIQKDLSEVPKIKINFGKISQVLTNLLINAGQAIRDNGQISISTKVKDQQILIAVKDNGSGIPPENLSKLFDPFFTTKDVGKGTGLGLSISHGIIQEHGGDITVTSKVNKGSCFTITLPILTENDNLKSPPNE
ncbi:ATP-binding protein [Aliiglaciecola sp. 3_MG-2023]|uniref:sensor histidine kinase n=1 Tax=Aliiglaciecola sp. 3_MG-2023 TaxID=3062644 RepID=UPI0026E412A3|nr:ATP-binding protein [Aliiglaciecola sp. 3_MG-2023]MDO6693201.1 ATP-binding protein [Aliiglaciecola sp. 3_MG-2023]